MFKKFTIIMTIFSISFSTNLTDTEKQMLDNEAIKNMMAGIFREAMKIKRDFQSNQLREELIENLASTAPREEFIVNADLSTDLAESSPSATIYVSTDGQENWTASDEIGPLLDQSGFENTWGTTINTQGGDNVSWYLSGLVNSEALGFDYGEIIVSQSPNNINNQWPPNSNLYTTLVNDESGDTESGQDIISLSGSYRGNETDIEELYVKLSLNSGCCAAGGLFGPWFLYGVGIVNPESETPVAYAIGYGDGGFGQLTPGLLKLSGDFESGEIAGFDYITTDINYSTSGNDMSASVLLDYITNDAEFGVWPNSLQGLIVIGVTVSADISINTTIHDQTNPGLFLLSSQSQNGNFEPSIDNPVYDDATRTLSIDYQDDDGNLPWFKSVQITSPGGAQSFLNIDMTPDSHTYLDGVNYSATIGEEFTSGDYEAHFWFEDGDEIGEPQVILPINIGGSTCGITGDVSGDGTVNVIDIVIVVNHILENTEDTCADLSGDGVINVIDIVQLVNIILDS